MSMEEVKRLDTSSIVQEYNTILVQEKTEELDETDDVFYSRMSLIKSRNAPPPQWFQVSKRKTTRSTHDKSGTKPIAQRKRPYGIFYKENLC